MTFSQILPQLSKPNAQERIPHSTLAYLRAQNKNNAHALILKKFRESGISQADICKRLGKEAAVVSRWLGSPTNWTLDTLCDLAFALSGEVVDYSTEDQLGAPKRNIQTPEWTILNNFHAFEPSTSSTGTSRDKAVELILESADG